MTAIIVSEMWSPDHGGINFALRPTDIPSPVTNYTVPIPSVPKFSGPAIGAVLTKKEHANGITYHYQRGEEPLPELITIVNSSGDVPTLRYASCFMASCNSGRNFSETLNHGVLLYSMDVTYAIIGGKEGKLGNDLTTAGHSWGATQYVRLLTNGKSWDDIAKFFNEKQYFEDASPKTPNNYKIKQY